LYQKVAEQENAYAQFSLGYCYQYGIGVKIDEQKAVELYQKASEQKSTGTLAQYNFSHVNTIAQNRLGICYRLGTGIETDYQKAIELFQKVAKQGNAYGQYNLGYAYEHGIGVEKNEQKAIELYEKAADQGFAKAKNKIYLLQYDDRSKLKSKVEELNKLYQSKKAKDV